MATATAPSTASAVLDPQTVVQQSLKKVSSIATLPEVTARIVRTVEDPKSTAAQLHQIVSHDPALVTRILKVVNSAFYGLPGQIASVERAIVMLGLNAIKNIAVAASVGQLFRSVQLCAEFTAKDLWTHCIAVAVTAREMARQMKVPIADEAFLAGMIHDIGIVVSLQTAPEKVRQVCERAKATNANFCDIEREIIGADHQQMGMGLAEIWKFPRPCQLVAGFHHQPAQLADHRLLVALVHVSDTICCQTDQNGFNLTAIHQKMDDSGLSDLKIDTSLIEQTRAKIGALVSSASSFL